MSKYGQYCPLAKAPEILGNGWTLLIIHNMFGGMTHFNDLERSLPGISRALLATRLRQLQQAGVIQKRLTGSGHKATEYQLTQAGQQLREVIGSLVVWGTTWAFDEPTPDELDPVLLMWWMRNRVNVDRLPEHRIVVQFDFGNVPTVPLPTVTFWLILTTDDVTICLTDPGYEINVLVTADLAAFFKLVAERISYQEALDDYNVSVEGVPSLSRAFPHWFGWSASAPAMSSARALNTASYG